MQDSIVLFERDDFYVSGVSVGGADLRFLVRPGDPITVQVLYCRRRHMTLDTTTNLGPVSVAEPALFWAPQGEVKSQ